MELLTRRVARIERWTRRMNGCWLGLRGRLLAFSDLLDLLRCIRSGYMHDQSIKHFMYLLRGLVSTPEVFANRSLTKLAAVLGSQ